MTISLKAKARARCQWLPDLEAYPGPRYKALVTAIKTAIDAGDLAEEERLPPQRLLADALGVTTGTVTRAYSEAERRGLVAARVGSGTYVLPKNPPQKPDFYHLEEGREDGSIDLSLSLMVPSSERVKTFYQALQQVAEDPEQLAAALAYQSERGQTRYLQVFVDWLARMGVEVRSEQLVVTDGGQHAMFIALQTLMAPGDLLVSDRFTYPGAIAAARQLHLRHQGVPMDSEGMDMEALERLCQQQSPKAVYVMPDLNNPTGCRMSLARRQQLAELAERYDFWILEDSVQFLPEAFRLPRMADLIPERTLYLFSTSKILAGGLRVGLIAAPEDLLPGLMASLRAHCWMAPPLMVALTCAWIESGNAERLLEWQWQEVHARQQLLADIFVDQNFSSHPYGFVVWLQLPEGWRASEFVRAAAEVGVRLLSAEPFCVGTQAAPQAVRLCVSPPAERSQLEEGLRRLYRLLTSPPQGRAVF